MNKTYAAAGLTSWRGGRNSPHSILGAGGKLGETCHELSIAGVRACPAKHWEKLVIAAAAEKMG